MEKGSFQSLEQKLDLSNLDANLDFSENNEATEDVQDEFSDFKHQALTTAPTHSQAPNQSLRTRITAAMPQPPEYRKSSTVEALIAQNEDVTARLKIAMRRMTMLEEENRHLQGELEQTKIAYASTHDQMLVWKEKEKIWKDRHEKAETALQAFRDRFPDFIKMEAKIEKLTRYQERVKTTIKPYLQQLKDYAQSLHLQIQAQNTEIESRDAQIQDKTREIMALKEKMDEQVRFYEMNQNDLVSGFENQKDFYQHEIKALSENLTLAEEKTQKLNASLERQDELENLVISLRRSKDDYFNQVQEELEALRNSNSETKKEIIQNQLKIADLQQDLELAKNQLAEVSNKKQDLDEQLTSLRYMWSEQSQEKEKMEISIASLEKLNLELSNKLSELRRKV